MTTQTFTPGTARRLLYINPLQIDVVMGILRLFSDECVCCLISDPMRSSLPDPTDGAMTCLSCGYIQHTLTMQAKPSGTVSRICLITSDPSDFLPSRNNPPSDQSTAAPVVIAYFPDAPKSGQGTLAETMRKLRDQMPIMARRHRLVFRMSRKGWRNFRMHGIQPDTGIKHVFERDSPYWKDVDLGDCLHELASQSAGVRWASLRLLFYFKFNSIHGVLDGTVDISDVQTADVGAEIVDLERAAGLG
ncbi:hypothetical protein PHLGIDRAFT_119263 [Phlebiopsis gigantea 11061_1 CR5-6]|uniref:Uncharacterized protein n=1 Tax=Phlebiopsis gigantea (strain 11061_1 CR5-6) TaxID=745531 RepID=A0A0C3S9C0_PHLG1|nr:hypothetical protein PHLGIDRAFT_119263 [Phlebiopsis gigantea 11061_1 CR5-6]